MRDYDGKEDPELWIMLYETRCRAAGGDEQVMANYLSVVMTQAPNQWLTR